MNRTLKVGVYLATAASFLVTLTPGSPAQAGSKERERPSAGVPALVNPQADLGTHAAGPEPTWNDSIYFTSQVRSGGHDLGVLVHTMQFPNNGLRTMSVSLTDQTAGWSKTHTVDYPAKDYNWSAEKLEIKAPGLSWTGNTKAMSVKVEVPWGSLDFRLKNAGPTMNYAGSGAFSLLGVPNYEFAFPEMSTTGTLSIDGSTHKVRGETWLDRQWGPINLGQPSQRWTWMNLALPSGDKVAIWDIVDGEADHAWATVLHPNGSHEVVSVKPLARGAAAPWTSPASSQVYPTRWRVDIPSLKTHLTVRVTGTKEQEIITALGGRYEGTARFKGTYEDKKVTGKTYVEMVGAWIG